MVRASKRAKIEQEAARSNEIHYGPSAPWPSEPATNPSIDPRGLSQARLTGPSVYAGNQMAQPHPAYYCSPNRSVSMRYHGQTPVSAPPHFPRMPPSQAYRRVPWPRAGFLNVPRTQPYGQQLYSGTTGFYRSFHASPSRTMYMNRQKIPNSSIPVHANMSIASSPDGCTRPDAGESASKSNGKRSANSFTYGSARILPSLSYPLPEKSEKKRRHRRSSSSSNLSTSQQLWYDRDHEPVPHDQSFEMEGFEQSESSQKSSAYNAKTSLTKGCTTKHDAFTTHDRGNASKAESSVSKEGKRLVLTVSASPTDSPPLKRREAAAAQKAQTLTYEVPPESPGILTSPQNEGCEAKDKSVIDDDMVLDDSCFEGHGHSDSFSLLPDLGKEYQSRTSPPLMPYLSIVPKLSWEIADENEEKKTRMDRPECMECSTEEESGGLGCSEEGDARLSSITPQSELRMMNEPLSGNATPLFFSQPAVRELASTPNTSYMNDGSNSHENNPRNTPTDLTQLWTRNVGHFPFGASTGVSPSSEQKYMQMSPGQVFATCEIARDELNCIESSHEGKREGPPKMLSSPGQTNEANPRRQLHHSPVPIRMPPPSPRSPYFAQSPPLLSSPLSSPYTDMQQWQPESKGKCIPLNPVPNKFQGDIAKMKDDKLPEFAELVNFPSHTMHRQNRRLPSGMKCCVMCGQIRSTCSRMRNKKCNNNSAPNTPKREKYTSGATGDDDVVIIPVQNKGLCTLCDINVWVITESGYQIKWCKGCKNFRPWAAFGQKGQATKCLRCRERQKEKYALAKSRERKFSPEEKLSQCQKVTDESGLMGTAE